MKFLLYIYLNFFGKKIGEDKYKNIYYSLKMSSGKIKRYVLYKGISEASKVPPSWEAWLRFSVNTPIENRQYKKITEYVPNLTGTKYAYHYNKNEIRSKNKYKSEWNPK